MADRIQIRRDTTANWASIDPVLAIGEMGVELGTREQIKIGDGVTVWSLLPYITLDGTDGTSGTSGVDGSYLGTDGTSGTSGINGSSGTSGTSGTSGIDGSSGTSGTSGVSGTSGINGSSGTSGTSGVSGTSGTSGVNGSSGTSGTSGVNGTSGTSGTSGVSLSRVRLTGNVTSTSTAFADVTGMGFSVEANTNYKIIYDVIYQSTAAGTGIAFAVNGPASPTLVQVITEIRTTTTTEIVGLANAYDTGDPTASNTANTNLRATVSVIFNNGANAGTLILRFASETGTAVSVRTGSIGEMSISP